MASTSPVSAAMEGLPPRESARFDVAAVALALLAAAGVVVTAALGVDALYLRAGRLERSRKDAVIATASTVSPRARQTQLLRGYRWVDEKAGVVALPIDRAMELVASGQGAPPREAGR